jgi:hypothetical protein
VSGCVGTILDDRGETLASARFPGRGSGRATGPAEFCFGIGDIDRCTARVAFSHREWIIAPWRAEDGVQTLMISSEPGRTGDR